MLCCSPGPDACVLHLYTARLDRSRAAPETERDAKQLFDQGDKPMTSVAS
jgi:hypothetical protein